MSSSMWSMNGMPVETRLRPVASSFSLTATSVSFVFRDRAPARAAVTPAPE